MRRKTLAAAFVGTLYLLIMTGGAYASSTRPPNILFVVIDTLRADRVDFYDTHRALTPFLDTLAAHGSIFWNAYAQSSWTMPSIASLWTSRYPSQHRVIAFNSVLPAREETLAEVLRAHGYVTAAFSANPLLTAPGFRQGFDVYDVFQGKSSFVKESAAALDKDVLSWLDAMTAHHLRGAPIFLHLQYMEPHAPYTPPQNAVAQILRRQADGPQLRRAYGDVFFRFHDHWKHPSPLELRAIRAMYDAEVLTVDAELRQFFAALRQRDFLKNTIIVVTADHGEGLMDHGTMNHGADLHNDVIHIPLLVLLPGQSERRDIKRVVSEIDIAPTMLDLAGIAAPRSFEGHSLRPLLSPGSLSGSLSRFFTGLFHPGASGRPMAYSELLVNPNDAAAPHQVRALVVGSEKLCVDSSGAYQSYDLAADPNERKSRELSAAEQQRLEGLLRVQEQQVARNQARGETAPLDAATKARMRALGYGQ